MRLIGIILVVIGLYFAIARPWFNSNFSGEEVASVTVYDKTEATDRSRGWRVNQILLDPENNPVRIRIAVHRLPGQVYNDGLLKLLVRVADVDTSGNSSKPILDENVTVHLNTQTSSSLPSGEAKTFVVSTSEFYVDYRGYHKIGALPVIPANTSINSADLDIDRNIIQIDASIIKAVSPIGSSGTVIGFLMVFGGFLLISFFKRRKAAIAEAQPPLEEDDGLILEPHPLEENPIPEVLPVEPEPRKKPEPRKTSEPRKTNVGKTIKWGRDAGKKR